MKNRRFDIEDSREKTERIDFSHRQYSDDDPKKDGAWLLLETMSDLDEDLLQEVEPSQTLASSVHESDARHASIMGRVYQKIHVNDTQNASEEAFAPNIERVSETTPTRKTQHWEETDRLNKKCPSKKVYEAPTKKASFWKRYRAPLTAAAGLFVAVGMFFILRPLGVFRDDSDFYPGNVRDPSVQSTEAGDNGFIEPVQNPSANGGDSNSGIKYTDSIDILPSAEQKVQQEWVNAEDALQSFEEKVSTWLKDGNTLQIDVGGDVEVHFQDARDAADHPRLMRIAMGDLDCGTPRLTLEDVRTIINDVKKELLTDEATTADFQLAMMQRFNAVAGAPDRVVRNPDLKLVYFIAPSDTDAQGAPGAQKETFEPSSDVETRARIAVTDREILYYAEEGAEVEVLFAPDLGTMPAK